MVGTLQDHMCRFIQDQTQSLKGCLVAAFDSREHYLSLLDESLGTPISSANTKLCELLADAGLFREEVRLTRDGRNRYKIFHLTDIGMETAKQIKSEGYNGPIPQNTSIDNT